ncbi:hypothetical protein PV326_013387 [Microctonus aethiopoides]|nr:hypothetical protein PV326_013387 [Microctonus aethiopoides]
MQYDPLDEASDMGHGLYNVCNRLSTFHVVLLEKGQRAISRYYREAGHRARLLDPTARGEEATQYEQPVDDASDSGSDAEELEPLSELDARTALHEETSRLMHVLGLSNLCGDYYYDYVGIEWLHLGRWGQDHPSEDIGSPVWMIPGVIYLIYSGDILFITRG